MANQESVGCQVVSSDSWHLKQCLVECIICICYWFEVFLGHRRCHGSQWTPTLLTKNGPPFLSFWFQGLYLHGFWIPSKFVLYGTLDARSLNVFVIHVTQYSHIQALRNIFVREFYPPHHPPQVRRCLYAYLTCTVIRRMNDWIKRYKCTIWFFVSTAGLWAVIISSDCSGCQKQKMETRYSLNYF